MATQVFCGDGTKTAMENANTYQYGWKVVRVKTDSGHWVTITEGNIYDDGSDHRPYWKVESIRSRPLAHADYPMVDCALINIMDSGEVLKRRMVTSVEDLAEKVDAGPYHLWMAGEL